MQNVIVYPWREKNIIPKINKYMCLLDFRHIDTFFPLTKPNQDSRKHNCDRVENVSSYYVPFFPFPIKSDPMASKIASLAL